MTKRLIYDFPQGIVGSLRPNDLWWWWWIDECIGFVENLLLGLMHTWCLMSDKNFWNCDLDGDDSWLWWLTAIGDHHTRGGERPAIRGITPLSAVAPSSQRDTDQGAARVSTSAFRSFWGQSGWHKLDWLLQSNLQKLWTRYHWAAQCRVKARKASRREIKHSWKPKVSQSVLPPKSFQDF